MKAGVITLIIVIILAILIGGFLFLQSEKVSCKKDARVCPDGSIVGRNPSSENCEEFYPCPVLNNSNNQSNITQNQTNQTQPRTYNIEISGFAFQIKELKIKVGDTVVWTNKDFASHTVTSDSGSELESPYFSKNQIYSHTFNQVGTFNYHCIPHPYMKGKIIVEE